MVYRWDGIHPGKGNAQAIAEELERLDTGKGITPQRVIRQAKRKNSALHECFEWDDTRAASAYREHQARLVICSIVRVVEREGEKPLQIRAFVNVGREYNKPGVYVLTQTAMSEPDMCAEVIARAYADLLAWKRRYQHLKDFADIIRAIDATPAPA